MKRVINFIVRKKELEKLYKIYNRYSEFTMINKGLYAENLIVAKKALELKGDVVECGVWRGGMIAGISEILGKDRKYFLFDSFEGLPEAKEIDGVSAKDWQKDVDSPGYYDNCKAEIDYSITAMNKAKTDFECVKGWFNETLPSYQKIKNISLLRLDADWYESTMVCFTTLFPKVVENGIIIIDDYYTWTGCSRAVHDYLSSIKSESRIYTSANGVAYIIKRSNS